MAAVIHAAVVAFLTLAQPALETGAARRVLAEPTGANRIRRYRTLIACLLAPTLLLVATTPWRTLTTPAFAGQGSLREDAGFQMAALCLLFGTLTGLLLPLLTGRKEERTRAEQLAQWRPVAPLLPASRNERRWFMASALSAAFCEELIYRGFLIQYMAHGPLALGPTWAIAGAAVFVAVGHFAPAWPWTVAAGVKAGFLTMLFLLAGHVWLPALVHGLLELRVLLIWPVEGGTAPPSG